MDVESADTTSVGDTLNGELKPDPAMLAQRAILKQVKDIKMHNTCVNVLCFMVRDVALQVCSARTVNCKHWV